MENCKYCGQPATSDNNNGWGYHVTCCREFDRRVANKKCVRCNQHEPSQNTLAAGGMVCNECDGTYVGYQP